MYKVLKGLGPEIMRSLFINSKFNGENSIRYFGPVVWDTMLPDKLKSIQTIEKFKTDIKKWIPTNCPCTLCREYIAGVGYINTFD